MEEAIDLGDSLDGVSLAERHLEFEKVMAAAPSSIRVLAGRLERVDTAGLQLLVAFQQDALRRGKTLTIEGASEVLTERAASVGLSGFLEAVGA